MVGSIPAFPTNTLRGSLRIYFLKRLNPLRDIILSKCFKDPRGSIKYLLIRPQGANLKRLNPLRDTFFFFEKFLRGNFKTLSHSKSASKFGVENRQKALKISRQLIYHF